MRRFILVLFIVLIALIIVLPLNSDAGDYFVGVKGYYSFWDSGILDWLEKDIAVAFLVNRVQFEAKRDIGSGYMVGPLLGYRTDDGKLSVSFAPMVLSSFDQDWAGTAGAMNPRGTARLDRQDYDLAVSYALNGMFKAFFGYKYQQMELKLDMTYTLMGTQVDRYIVDAHAHVPTFGVGAAYPVMDKVVLSGQAGISYPMMDMKITNENGVTEDILPQGQLGFNTEINVTYQAIENVLVQLGYRYQMFEFTGRAPGRTEAITSRDITHGVTLAVFYTF
ncbi:MAG: hypothetical protein JSV21_09990 [Nitrospirota bacterium]|nr:MAG: hypothetical protein JSV21_09990 [Nitrospirota bacterium]